MPDRRDLQSSRRREEPPAGVAAPAGYKLQITGRARRPAPLACYMCPTSDIFTIAWVVKNALSTAPMLMYQHSRSGVSMPGRKHIVASALCTSCDDAPTTNSRLNG